LAFGPLGDDAMLSPRVAPATIGLGLLEAVPEATILALADPADADGDGVSGRPNRVAGEVGGGIALGRFGWKANQPSLRRQNAAAALGDIGLTSTLFPDENCAAPQDACRAAKSGGAPELSDAFLDKLTLYTRLLAVPRQRGADAEPVRHGEQLFRAAGCAACHMPTLVTGAHPLAELAGQVIHPFTDLLLHDMGEGLADGRPDFAATGREWRTAPLWGLGLVETVNGHTYFLHDGRARNLAEAILWHGGEAEAARERFRALPRGDREALLAFLRSL
ncbi:MAG TPA: di-heme oxidoredictase family protein, partial [Alphaproteobacteria bacterium]